MDESQVSSVDQKESFPLEFQKLDLQHYGENGLDWAMTSPRVKGNPETFLFQADELHIRVYEKDNKTADIHADQGIFNTAAYGEGQKGEVINVGDNVPLRPGDIYLDENVVVISSDGAKLETDWMIFHRDVDIIDSTAPVRVTRPDSIINGIGFQAKPDLSRAEIFHQTLTIREDDEETPEEETLEEESSEEKDEVNVVE